MTLQSLLDICIALTICAALSWLSLTVALFFLRPSTTLLTEARSLVPSVIRLVRNLSRDKTIGRSVRIRLVLLLAYLVSPIDLVPDFLPIIGWADDVIVVGFVLRGIIKRAGTNAVLAHWEGTESNFSTVLRLCRLSEIKEPE